MAKKKVLVMVLAADVQGYDALIRAIRSTWGEDASDDFKIVYYYGYRDGHPKPEPNKILRIGDDIICGCEENMHSICHKTLMAYEYVLSKFEFDYTFRCCCGSYVARDELMKFIEDKPSERFYCGIIGHDDPPFASGSGYFLSRDLVGEVVKNKEKILGYPYPGYQDDVAIGRFMKDMDVVIDPTARRKDFSVDIVPGMYHYHMGKNGDGSPMHEIHAKLREGIVDQK